jgi:hypothetical protein
MHGNLTCQNNATIRIRIKANSIVVADTGLITLAHATSNHYDLSIYFTVRQIGVAGVARLMTTGTFTYNKSSNNIPERAGIESLNSTNFNTTIDNVLDITAQWGSASASNSIDTHMFNLYKIF